MSVRLPEPVRVAAPPASGGAEVTLPDPAAARCENCGSTVAERFCGHCGQRLETPVHSVMHFAHDAVEDLTHADSRLWATLGTLLFKPGQLTREFLHGRRARYLPPIRLYLVLSVLFFLVASLTQRHPEVITVSADDQGKAVTKVYDVAAAPRPGETEEQSIARQCSDVAYNGPFAQRVRPMLPEACRKILVDHGRSLQEAFLHNIPRAMFLFLPLLAGVMTLLYWRPRHYYVEHLLLFVHNHAFVFLLGALVLLVPRSTPYKGLLNGAVFVYLCWYMYRSMRIVYGQGRALTLGKLALLSLFYLIFAALMLGLTSAYTALTL
jgi:hypothetical protein